MLDALAERCRRMLLKNNKGIVIRHLEYLWCDTHTDTVGTARFVIDSNFHDPPICGHFFLAHAVQLFYLVRVHHTESDYRNAN